MISHPRQAKQVGRQLAQRLGNPHNINERDILLSTLYLTNIGSVQITPFREVLLAEFDAVPLTADSIT